MGGPLGRRRREMNRLSAWGLTTSIRDILCLSAVTFLRYSRKAVECRLTLLALVIQAPSCAEASMQCTAHRCTGLLVGWPSSQSVSQSVWSARAAGLPDGMNERVKLMHWWVRRVDSVAN